MGSLTRYEGLPGEDLILYFHVRDQNNLNLVDPFSISDVNIYSVDPDKLLANAEPVLTLTPNKISCGTYFVQFKVPIDWCPGRYYDKWAVVVDNGQTPTTLTETFLVRSRSVILGQEAPVISLSQAPRVTLLTKEIRAGETKQLLFVLSEPVNTPMPPVEVQIQQDCRVVLDWTPAPRSGNEGSLLVNLPEKVSPGILRVRFRLKYADQLYLTPLNDLRLLTP